MQLSYPGKERKIKAVVLITTAFIIAAAITNGLLLSSCGSGSDNQVSNSSTVSTTTSHPSAAIIDQLSFNIPNPDFVFSATSLLKEAGYTVDYYPSEQVTVPLYLNLPSFGYNLIILRVHSGMSQEIDSPTTQHIGLFTGEPITGNMIKYDNEGIGQGATYNETFEFGSLMYIIGDRFVEKSMRGKFNKTIVILMGCDALKIPNMAQALLDKGAGAVVGWTEAVMSNHTDAATFSLLQKYLHDKMTIEDAVAQTEAEVGPDPSSNAELTILSNVAHGGGERDDSAHTQTVTPVNTSTTTTTPPLQRAIFTISNLSISPAEVDKGQRVTISVIVINIGDLAGNYTIDFKVNGLTRNTYDIPLEGHNGTQQFYDIDTGNMTTGTHYVDLNGLSGTFTIKDTTITP